MVQIVKRFKTFLHFAAGLVALCLSCPGPTSYPYLYIGMKRQALFKAALEQLDALRHFKT